MGQSVLKQIDETAFHVHLKKRFFLFMRMSRGMLGSGCGVPLLFGRDGVAPSQHRLMPVLMGCMSSHGLCSGLVRGFVNCWKRSSP